MLNEKVVSLSIVDTDTGEIKEVKSIKRRERRPRFYMITHDSSKMLANMNLSKNEYRVLLMLQSKVGYKNSLFVNKTKLAEEFKCDRVMLSKAMKMLEAREIINRTGNGYRFGSVYLKCGE